MIFLKSFIIGFLIAAPVGPIGLLCIQRTMNKGKLSGIFTGLGAASADAIYGFVAAVGLTLISGFLMDFQLFIKFFGSAFLIYLGIKIFLDSKKEKPILADNVLKRDLAKDYLSTFLLTLTNPATIIAFLAIFASLSVLSKNDSIVVVSGVFLGSLFWWLILSSVTDLLRQKVKLAYVNIISGIVIIIFALSMLFS